MLDYIFDEKYEINQLSKKIAFKAIFKKLPAVELTKDGKPKLSYFQWQATITTYCLSDKYKEQLLATNSMRDIRQYFSSQLLESYKKYDKANKGKKEQDSPMSITADPAKPQCLVIGDNDVRGGGICFTSVAADKDGD